MKILFMGTPDFASEILDSLHSYGYNIIGAVSQPDKPKGRGHKLMPTDVKLKAEKLGIALYQPQTLKDEAFLPTLKELDPDLIVVAAYGKILPEYKRSRLTASKVQRRCTYSACNFKRR